MDNLLTCDIGRCKIKYRPWKVKDKFNIKDAKTPYDARKALVYNCLENPNIALDVNEFQYVLFCIRNSSINYTTEYKVTCDHCKKEYFVDVPIKDALSVRFADYSTIETKNHVFALQEVKNQKFYEEAMQNETDAERRFLLDFIMHISSIDDDFSKSATDVFDFINSMDVVEFEDLMQHWQKQHFASELRINASCPYCNERTDYRLLGVPNFFPESWNEMKWKSNIML